MPTLPAYPLSLIMVEQSVVRQLRLHDGTTLVGLTDTGQKRRRNEDHFDIDLVGDPITGNQTALLMVADGMGGHDAGNVASQLAVQTAMTAYREAPVENSAELLLRCVETANQAVYARAQGSEQGSTMGTTCVLATVRDGVMHAVNVGDSRGYVINRASVEQFTTDHSWVQEQYEAGRLTKAELANHPRRNLITRAVGIDARIAVDTFTRHLAPGESVLLCSDGLWGYFTPDELAEVVRGHAATEAVQRLIEMANARGGEDNITVVLLDRSSTAQAAGKSGSGKRAPATGSSLWKGSNGLVVLAALVMLLLAVLLWNSRREASKALPEMKAPPGVTLPEGPEGNPLQGDDMLIGPERR